MGQNNSAFGSPFAGSITYTTPALNPAAALGGYGGSYGGGGGGLSFSLPLAALASFNNQALGFSQNANNNALGFVQQNLSQGLQSSNYGFSQNQAFLNNQLPIFSNFLQGQNAIAMQNAQTAQMQASNSGGLFGGGGFLGLGL